MSSVLTAVASVLSQTYSAEPRWVPRGQLLRNPSKNAHCHPDFSKLGEQELLQHDSFSRGGDTPGKPPCLPSQALLRRDDEAPSPHKGVAMERMGGAREDSHQDPVNHCTQGEGELG